MERDEEKTGWSIRAWCGAVGIARPTYYTLPAEARPDRVMIGSKPIITESPPAWFKRVRKSGGVVKLMRPKSKRTARSSQSDNAARGRRVGS
jgi:hypothetical protein